MIPHLIGQKSGKISPSRWKVYILFTEINTPHLIGQKIAVLKGVPLKIYNLFTDQGHSLLNSHGNCKKLRLFFKKFILSLYSHENAVLAGYWREWFTACLQKQQASHLIGQKSGDFQPLRLKVYILFTKFSSLYLYSLKNNSFLIHISKNYISSHLYEFLRGIGDLIFFNPHHLYEKLRVFGTPFTRKRPKIFHLRSFC